MSGVKYRERTEGEAHGVATMAAWAARRDAAAPDAPRLFLASDKNPLSYRLGEEMRFAFTAENAPPGATIRWRITDDDGKLAVGTASAQAAPALPSAGSCAPAVQTAGLSRPGFAHVAAELVAPGGEVLARCDGGAGAAVADIRPDFPEPPDFDDFWARRLAPLLAQPPRGVAEGGAIAIPCPGGRPSTGFLSIPRAAAGRRFPARVHFHGYDESWRPTAYLPPRPESLPEGEIYLDMAAHGYEPGREPEYYAALRAAAGSNGHDYAFDPVQNADPDTAYFGGMAWRVLRGLEYVRSLPEWDGKTLVVEGGSCGALQAVWCAALDHAVTECRIFIPWCCNIGGPAAGRARGDWHVEWTPALGYYDAANMAPRIPATCRVEILFAGLGDYICPPSGVMAFYNRLSCPKRATFVQCATHGYFPHSPLQTGRLEGKNLDDAGVSQ